MSDFYEYDAPDEDCEIEVCKTCVRLQQALEAAAFRVGDIDPFDLDNLAIAVRDRNWALDDLFDHQDKHK